MGCIEDSDVAVLAVEGGWECAFEVSPRGPPREEQRDIHYRILVKRFNTDLDSWKREETSSPVKSWRTTLGLCFLANVYFNKVLFCGMKKVNSLKKKKSRY